MSLEKKQFEKRLARDNLQELLKLYDLEWNWNWGRNSNKTDIDRLFDKTFSLVTTVAEGRALLEKLCTYGHTYEREDLLLRRMIELAQTEEDLCLICYHLGLGEEINRRNMIRTLFDKADELGIDSRTDLRPSSE